MTEKDREIATRQLESAIQLSRATGLTAMECGEIVRAADKLPPREQKP